MPPDPQALDAAAIRAALDATAILSKAYGHVSEERHNLSGHLRSLNVAEHAEDHPVTRSNAAYAAGSLLAALRLMLPRLVKAEAQLTSILMAAEIAALPSFEPAENSLNMPAEGV